MCSPTVMFSSMTSLQREEFFELVATSQSRRLDDQRAEPASILPLPPLQAQASAPEQPKPSERKLSIRPSVMKKATKAPPPKDELYNMILTSQVIIALWFVMMSPSVLC